MTVRTSRIRESRCGSTPGPGAIARAGVDALRTRHAEARGLVDRRGLHRLGRNQLQRQAPGASADRRRDRGSQIRRAPDGPTRRPAASSTRVPAAETADRMARCRGAGPTIAAFITTATASSCRTRSAQRPSSKRRGWKAPERVPIFTRSFELGPESVSWFCKSHTCRRKRSLPSRHREDGRLGRVGCVFGSRLRALGVIAAGLSVNVRRGFAWVAAPRRKPAAHGSERRRTHCDSRYGCAAAESGRRSARGSHGNRSTRRPPPDLASFTHGGPPRWAEVLSTTAKFGRDNGPFAVDVLTHPESNPWLCQMRFDWPRLPARRQTGCALHLGRRRVAGRRDRRPVREFSPGGGSPRGLFQPLGIKVVDGQIYVSCRDQIAILHDLNGDGETDFYENFNSDHQVTEHFHEFAMGLADRRRRQLLLREGRPSRLPAVVPHHGTLLRVSRDGAAPTSSRPDFARRTAFA